MITEIKHNSVQTTLSAVSEIQSDWNHKVLQPILYDMIDFSRTIKQLHWNIVGLHFRPAHLFLDEIYATLEESTDMVAERMSATGHSPNGKIQDIAKHSTCEVVPEGFIQDSDVLLLAQHGLRHLIGAVRARGLEIEDIDRVTSDMLHKISFDLEKHHWMLAAQRV